MSLPNVVCTPVTNPSSLPRPTADLLHKSLRRRNDSHPYLVLFFCESWRESTVSERTGRKKRETDRETRGGEDENEYK